MSKKANQVYLDRHNKTTASDLTSIAQCDGWIERLNADVDGIAKESQTERTRSALYYRKQALRQVTDRKLELIRTHESS